MSSLCYMGMMVTAILLFLFVILGPSQDITAEEFSKLQGNWTVTAAELRGMPFDIIKGGHLTITGKNFAVHTATGRDLEGELRINSTTSPAQLDFVHSDGT